MKRTANFTQLFKYFVIVFILLIFLVVIIFPITTAFIATRSAKTTVEVPPQGFEEAILTTEDNIKLAGWYAAPQNATVIILVHGAGNTREKIKDHALLLLSEGYGVLAIDLRGHGESEGQTNKYGWEGTKDIGAAVNFLKAKPEVKNIGALGLSLGGEILLGSASSYPEIKAIASEGATYRCFDEFNDIDTIPNFQKNFSTMRIQDIAVKIFSDQEPPQTILSSVQASNHTKYLFIAAGNNQTEVDFNKLFYKKTQVLSSLWVVPNTNHTQGLNTHKDEYKDKLIGFYKQAFNRVE